MVPLRFRWLLGLFYLLALGKVSTAWAQHQAAVEVRVPQPPQPVLGSDGLPHLAYELHVTNFYQRTGTLALKRLAVFANESTEPLAAFSAKQLSALLAHPPQSNDTAASGVPIEAGKRVVLFLWLTIPANGAVVNHLSHQLVFETTHGEHQVVNGVNTSLNNIPPLVFWPPLRTGVWLVHEGPGNPHSHHWGSVVAANGLVTIPQRYAIDFFGLDATEHAVKVERSELAKSAVTDWRGFGAPVLAVADGVVRDMRDGEPNQVPLAPLPPLTDLTVRTLMGNFIVLEVAPHIFVQYAHLRPGSLTVKVGDRVHRGTVLGQLGQSGNANAPHLHFQVTTTATFEESEGLPFVFLTFERLGAATIAEVLDRSVRVSPGTTTLKWHRNQMPLNGDVIEFK